MMNAAELGLLLASLVPVQEAWQDRKVGAYPEGITSEVFASLIFSPDKTTVAFLARAGGEEHAIVGDQKVASAAGGISVCGFTDDNRVVYSVNTQGASYVMTGSQKGEVFDKVILPYMPRRGRLPRLAYQATRGTRNYLVDGTKAETYEGVSGIRFTPDGKHLAFAVLKGGRWSYVIDGRPGAPYDQVEWLVLGHDGRAAIFVGKRGGQSLTIVDGKEYGPYEYVEGVTASADGKVTAFVAAQGGRFENFFGSKVYRGGKHSAVINGVKGPEYDAVKRPTVSSNGRVAYAAQQGGKWFVVLDGKKGPEFEDVSKNYLAFSPDGSRLAYGANVGGKFNESLGIVRGGVNWLVVDHVKKAEGIWSGDLFFSPDGKHVVYSEWRDRKKTLVVGTKKGQPVDEVYGDTIDFSPDGKRVGAVVRIGREHWWKTLDLE